MFKNHSLPPCFVGYIFWIPNLSTSDEFVIVPSGAAPSGVALAENAVSV